MNSIVDTDVISWAARFGMKSRVVCIHHQKIFKDITSEDVMRVLFNFRTMEWWIIQPCNALCRNVPWLLPSHGGGWGRVQLLPRDKAVDQWMMHGWMITILQCAILISVSIMISNGKFDWKWFAGPPTEATFSVCFSDFCLHLIKSCPLDQVSDAKLETIFPSQPVDWLLKDGWTPWICSWEHQP